MMKILNKKRKIGNKGFSLVELIIVIAIMAVLVAILAPQYLKYVEKSRVAADDTFTEELMTAVQVALTDETVYADVVTGDKLTWTESTGAIASTDCPDLQTEVVATLAATHDVQAKAHDGQVYTITITIDGTTGNYSLAGEWADA